LLTKNQFMSMIETTLKRALRFFTFTFPLITLCFHFSSAQNYREYTGQSATELISGTEMVIMDEQNDLPVFVRFAQTHQLQLSTIELFFNKNFNAKKIFNKRVEEDNLGFTQYRYQQMREGFPILGAEYILHVKDGVVKSMNGKFFSNFSSVVSPSISENSALNIVLSSVAANVYKWQIAEEEEMLKVINNDPDATYFPTGKLVFAPVNGDFVNSEFRLCWEFDVYAHEPMTRERIYLDATTGEIVFRENRIQHSDVLGTATTAYSGTVAFTSDSYSGSYRMRENDRGIGSGMETYDLNNGTNYGAAVDFTHPDADWNSFSPSIDQYATDAHFGTEMSYDYFYSVHGRNSYDNTGTTLFSYVHYGNNYDNAFWNGTAMTYGDGGGGYFTSPLTTMDVCGHEITHAVTQYTAGLVYSYEPGQLNESFSDIFGTAIEWWATPAYADWLIGDDCVAGGMRSMSNPNALGQPDTYLGTYWYYGSGDNGGVHYNSGVQNFWYYLLVNGGSGTNDNGDFYSVTGIGQTDADDIAYRNLSVYLTPSSQHVDSRIGAIAAATDLFGACSPEVIAVTNAWYAVGVGAIYTAGVTADFSASPTSSCSAPATVQFTNLSTNGSTFAWTFGDGGTSNTTNPSHTYSSTGLYTVSLTSTSACGTDTETKTNYINIDNSLPCNMIPNGTLTLGGCTGTLYDSGGSGSDYQDNENSIVVISPSGATSVSITFTSFFLETGYDYLYIYNGPNTGSPLLGAFDGNALPNGGAAITASSGSMTIQLVSDVFVTEFGFAADWTCSQGAPVTDFIGYYQSSCSGLVNFTDLTVGAPTSWAWNFGDGNTSNQQNPAHTYGSNGTYNVSLTATNGFGSDSETKNGYITVSKAAGPTTTNTTICTAGNATLTASGTGVTWHTASIGGSQVGSGSPFTFSAPSTTTYYAQNTVNASSQYVGKTNNSGGGGYFNGNQWLIFDADQPFELVSVLVYANGSGNRTIRLRDNLGNDIYTGVFSIPNGSSRVYLNWNVPVGTNMQITADPGSDLYRNNASIIYPYTIAGLVSITNSSAGVDRYYYFYDWEIQTEDCVSLRTAATAFVSDLAISTSSTPSSCSGNTGTATATVTAGSYPSFTYAWSNGGNTSTITNLAGGTYTVTVTDGLSCTRTSSVVVGTAGDAIPPVISTCPPNVTVNLNGSCEITLANYIPSTVATDNCGSVTITQSPVAGTVVSGVGTTTVTMTATDGSGNTTTCSFVVTRADVTVPSITTCPGTQTQFLNGSCQITLADYTSSVIATDNCSSVTKTQSPASGTVISGVGTTSVTVTCTDASGNSSTCTFNVSRVDNTAPSITTCPGTQTQFLNGSCQITLADYTSSVVASDNCSSVTKTQSPAAGTVISGVGTTSVTVTCIDASGNSSTCTFNVSRVDNTAPSITTCPGTQTQFLNGSCQITLADYTSSVVVSDNCSSVTKTQSPASGTVINGVGTTSVTVTCTDASGNSTTCTFDVSRVDNTGPSISTCPSTQTQFLNGSCQITLADYTSMVVANDNCSAVTKTQSPAAGTVISGVGTTSVTVTCTDASGNSSTCIFNVLRVDNTAPVISGCPSNIISNSPVVFWSAPTATDNCSAVNITSNYNPGDTFPLGTTTVNYVAMDATGNSSFCSFTVTYVSSSGAPVNDNCIDAIDLSSALSKYTFMSSALNCVSVVGSNLNSTVEASEAGGGCSTMDVTVWYRFVSPTCGPFTMDFSTDNPNTNFDTVVDLLYSPNGTCDFSQMVAVGCNDDALGGCIGGSSALNSTFSTASLVTGGVYYVKVDGASAATGTFELTVTVEPDATVLTGGTYPATEMNVAWSNANGNHYDLYWKQTSSNAYASATGLSGTSYLLQNLIPATSYDVQIKNVCIPNGVEKYYSPLSTLSTAASTCSSPGMPFCITQTISSITIGWANVPAAVYYKIFWRKTGNVGYGIVNNVTGTTWTFNNLLLGTGYEFWVRAVCNVNNPSENVTGPHGFCFTLGSPKLGNVFNKQTDYQFNFNGATYFNWDPADLNIDGDISGVEIVNGELQIIPEKNQSINSLSQINIYPNPAETSAIIEMDLNATGEVRINIYNLQGEIISSHSVMAESTHLTYSLSLNEIPSGIYQVVIETNGEVMMKKLAVVK